MADRQITIQNPIADPQQHRFPALLEHLRSNKIESQDDGDLDNELKILEKRVHEIKLEQRRRVPEGGVAFTRQLTEGGPPRPYADLPETVNYAPAINIKFYKHLCTDVCGVVKPTPSPNHRVILPPQEDTGVPRPFKCVICKSGFTRPAHVEDHFKKACVKRNGNPHGFHWFDDTTLLDHYAVRRGRGPSYWERTAEEVEAVVGGAKADSNEFSEGNSKSKQPIFIQKNLLQVPDQDWEGLYKWRLENTGQRVYGKERRVTVRVWQQYQAAIAKDAGDQTTATTAVAGESSQEAQQTNPFDDAGAYDEYGGQDEEMLEAEWATQDSPGDFEYPDPTGFMGCG